LRSKRCKKRVKLKNKELLCVDGGVGANNPTEEAYAHVKDLVAKSGKKYNIRFLSLRTGVEEKVKLDANAGKLGFGNPGNIPGYFMGATEAKIDAHMKKLAEKGKIELSVPTSSFHSPLTLRTQVNALKT